jgi:type IV pilus assembly protein PilO
MANLDLKNPALHKLALSLLGAGGMLGVFFFTHLLPFGFQNQQERVNALKATYEKKSTDLARARTTVADLPRFEAEYGQLHEQWVLAAELLPTDKDLPTLLRKISLSGQQTGITFMMFRPSPPRAETYYSEMPVNVVVQGGYHQVGSFLAELSNLRRIVTVSNMRLTASTKTDDPSITTSAEFTASAYSLNTTPVAPPPADTKKKKSDADNQGDNNAHKGS